MHATEIAVNDDDTLDPEELAQEDQERRWREYCAKTAKVDRRAVLLVALERLAEHAPELDAMVDDICQTPYRPGERRTVPGWQAKPVAETFADAIAGALDDLVGMQDTYEGDRV